MDSKKASATGTRVLVSFSRTGNHADVGFYILKKNEKPPLREKDVAIGRVNLPSKAKPVQSKRPILGWVDFSLNGDKASTTSTLPTPQMIAEFGLSIEQLAIMRLVFLEKSIKTLASNMVITHVGTSGYPSEFTASQIKGIGLEAGVLYPIGQFLKALSEGIKKGLDALGGA
jgi:hypothetical protein